MFRLKQIQVIFGLLILLVLFFHTYAFTEETKEEIVPEYNLPSPNLPQNNFFSFIKLVFKISISLALIIVMVYFTIYGLKVIAVKFTPNFPVSIGTLEILDFMRLAPNHMIYLVNVCDKKILIVSFADRQIHLLDKIDDIKTVEEILNKIREKWQKARPFKEDLRLANKKQQARQTLKNYLNNLKDFIRSSKV